MKKECPPDKILNPETKRCVLKIGAIGKKLLQKELKNKSHIKPVEAHKKPSPVKPNKTKKIKEQKKYSSVKPVEAHKKKSSVKIKKIKEQKKKSPVKPIEEPKKKSPVKPVEEAKNKSKSSLKSFDYATSSSKIQRFINFNIITEYLNKLIKIKKDECIVPYKEPNTYLLTKDILLYKQIGSKSAFGVVYKCKNINPNYTNIPFFTIKLQLKTTDVKKEILMLKFLTEYAIKNNFPNLPIIYKSLECGNIIRDDKYPLLLAKANNRNKTYSLIINEIASGDLRHFTTKELTEEIWKNIYEQIYMSLAVLHSLGISHNDTHDGNFLYHKIKPGGCFHYNINGTDYYIKNLGYLWTSWDYGNVSKLYNIGYYIFDYMKINTMMRKYDITKETEEYRANNYYHDFSHWGYVKTEIPKSILNLQQIIFDHTGGLTKKSPDVNIFDKKMTEDKWLKYLLDNNLLFSKVPVGPLLSSNKIDFIEYTGSFLYSKDAPFLGSFIYKYVGK